MENKFDVLSAVKGEEGTIFYMPRRNYRVAGKATLDNGQIYSNITNVEYVGYKHLDVTGKNIAVIYAIWLILAFGFSNVFKNYSLFTMTLVIVGFDLANKKRSAEYIANVYLWTTNPLLKEQKSWIGATIMTMKAYKRLKRIPEIEEIKKESIYFSYETKYTFVNLAEAISLTTFGIIDTFRQVNNGVVEIIMMSTLMCLSYLLLNTLRPFMGGYRISKPNDNQIEVAREALKEYEAMISNSNFNTLNVNAGNNSDQCYGILFSVEMDK